MKKIIQLILTISLAFLLQNCENNELDSGIVPETTPALSIADDIFQSENFGNATSGNFIGLITDESGAKLENVQITIGNVITMTDRNGLFVLNNADVFEKFAYVKAKKNGYIDGSRVIIPKTEGANRVNIVLLKKEIVSRVNSGENSQVSLSNGAIVNFSGGFITTDGNSYSGEVDVVVHHIRPNSINTFEQMPGSLLAQDASNNAQNLETYGMLSVNLFSPSGERLNIDPESPATLEFPVDYTQTSIAPETINLWYFDEEVGYWKEEGQAVKNGNKYIAEVTHFTWWNCDIPFDAIIFCFDIIANNVNANTPYLVVITRASNNQVIYSGNITSRETECGLIPRNEEVLVSVYSITGGCNNQLVYSETLGDYATDTSTTISFTEELTTTTLTGTALNCNGSPITNGYVYINDTNIFNLSNGDFSIGVIHCLDGLNIDVQIFDYDTNQWAIYENVVLSGVDTNVGVISTCGDGGGIYNGDVTLLTQNDVNNFGIMNFTTINGKLKIGEFQLTNNISSLGALNSLVNIHESLTIINNPNLTSLDGLNNLNAVNSLSISHNSSLNSITALSSITSIEFGFQISYNNALTTLAGLENINTPNALNITLSNNEVLTSIDALQSLTTANNISIHSNAALTSLTSFSNITTARSINLSYLPSLNSLQGLNQLTELSMLRIRDIDAITDLSALSNITSADIVSIGGNDALTSLNGLDNLTNIDWMLIGNDLEFDIVVNSPNNSLTDFCALQNLFTNGTYPTVNSTFNGVYIENNLFNPSIQDIIDGNCSQ
ncbi:hypothetical protein [uncultured Kordia sp.]|uniref:hypothetical protein n=1 Tax=uncultured Kordia sp. TaxID=507699 RepID=UPI00263163BD|nr:hypothetical protein [uncultured Kordia sp.]